MRKNILDHECTFIEDSDLKLFGIILSAPDVLLPLVGLECVQLVVFVCFVCSRVQISVFLWIPHICFNIVLCFGLYINCDD